VFLPRIVVDGFIFGVTHDWTQGSHDCKSSEEQFLTMTVTEKVRRLWQVPLVSLAGLSAKVSTPFSGFWVRSTSVHHSNTSYRPFGTLREDSAQTNTSKSAIFLFRPKSHQQLGIHLAQLRRHRRLPTFAFSRHDDTGNSAVFLRGQNDTAQSGVLPFPAKMTVLNPRFPFLD
jgi:hypothetical protein